MANTVASSGYKDLETTPLGDGVIYAGTIVDRNYEEDMLYHITNPNILEELLSSGQVIQFNKPARVGPWRDYELNQHLVADQPTSDSFCITVCNQAYKAIKFDKQTIRKAKNWEAYESEFLADAWRQLSELWHTRCLTDMQLKVSNRNLGKSAGLYGNIDLGSIGVPLHLTPDNIISFFNRMGDVIRDSGRWYDGEMFMVVPRAMHTLLLETMFSKQLCCNTMESVLFRGMKARDILGFTIVESERLRPVIDRATGRLVYPILAGWQEAYAFTGDIVDARLMEMENSFGVQYQMHTVFGGGVVYPEAMSKAYVTFSTDGTVNR